jgi:hypothetical protein
MGGGPPLNIPKLGLSILQCSQSRSTDLWHVAWNCAGPMTPSSAKLVTGSSRSDITTFAPRRCCWIGIPHSPSSPRMASPSTSRAAVLPKKNKKIRSRQQPRGDMLSTRNPKKSWREERLPRDLFLLYVLPGSRRARSPTTPSIRPASSRRFPKQTCSRWAHSR